MVSTRLALPFAALRKLGSAALDLVLPRKCAGCDALLEQERAFCAACEISLVSVGPHCERCGQPDAQPLCSGCQLSPVPFLRARAPWLYGGQLAHAIRQLKYHHRTDLVPSLADLMLPVAREATGVDLVVPVPLHRRKLIERGFNQASLLARAVARDLDRPLACRALVRLRNTPSQIDLDRAARQLNMAGAFAPRRPGAILGRRVLLVDDLLTTGATATACTLALLAGGAHTVEVLTLARAT